MSCKSVGSQVGFPNTWSFYCVYVICRFIALICAMQSTYKLSQSRRLQCRIQKTQDVTNEKKK